MRHHGKKYSHINRLPACIRSHCQTVWLAQCNIEWYCIIWYNILQTSQASTNTKLVNLGNHDDYVHSPILLQTKQLRETPSIVRKQQIRCIIASECFTAKDTVQCMFLNSGCHSTPDGYRGDITNPLNLFHTEHNLDGKEGSMSREIHSRYMPISSPKSTMELPLIETHLMYMLFDECFITKKVALPHQ